MPTSGPTYTVGYLVDRTFDLLLGSQREEVNRLTNDLDNVTTTFSVDFPPGDLVRGTYLAIDDESMYVWTSTPGSGSTSSVTVQRGQRGTTATTHSAGTVMFVNPYFTRWQVRNSIQDVIRSWAPQVFSVQTVDITLSAFVQGYDLGNISPWMFGLDCRISPDLLYATTDPMTWSQVSYRTEQMAPTTDFPSGNAIYMTDPTQIFDVPRSLHFTYAAPFNVDTGFSDTVDLLGTVGMDSSDLDIPPYGAAARLAAGREMRRLLTEAQGEVVDLQQFPAGYAINIADGFQKLHDQRFNDAVQRLRAKYPLVRSL